MNKRLSLLCVAAILAACSPDLPPPVTSLPASPVAEAGSAPVAAQQPVIIQQGGGDSSLMPALAGAAAGYMIGSMGNRPPAYAPPQVHTQTIVRERVVTVPAKPKSSWWSSKPSTSSPVTTTSPGMTQRSFTSSRTVSSPSSSWSSSRSSSFSSSSSSRSFSSSRR